MDATTTTLSPSLPIPAGLDTPAAETAEPATRLDAARRLVPGLFLAALIATQAFALHALPAFASVSPLILAILLGMAFHNIVGTPARAAPGIAFAAKRVLRLGVMLLGLQLTYEQILRVGGIGVAVLAATLIATFVFTVWLGRRLGVERKLAELIAAGTSVCGASAVMATNTVTRGADEDVAYAVACVTVFGSISMLLYPVLGSRLGLDAHAYGLWAGASIHEVAQVVAAAFQHGQEAGEFGTVAKLSRVMMLAPLVLALRHIALAARRKRADTSETAARVPLPWFVLGFVALVLINSQGIVPVGVKALAVPSTLFLLAVALAALGLTTDVAKLRAKGWRPLVLGAGAWIFITLFSIGLVMLTA